MNISLMLSGGFFKSLTELFNYSRNGTIEHLQEKIKKLEDGLFKLAQIENEIYQIISEVMYERSAQCGSLLIPVTEDFNNTHIGLRFLVVIPEDSAKNVIDNIIPIEGSIAGQTFSTKEVIYYSVRTARTPIRPYKIISLVTGLSPNNMISYPLIDGKDKCIGVLQLLNKKNGEFNINDANYISKKIKDRIIDLLKQLINDSNFKYYLPPIKRYNRYQKILVTDISNSKTLFDQFGALSATDFFNRYINEMASIVVQYDGIINSYLGDGIFARFNKLDDIGGFIEDIHKKFTALQQEWNAINIFHRSVIGEGGVFETTIGHPNKLQLTAYGEIINECFELIERLDRNNHFYVLPSKHIKDFREDSDYKILSFENEINSLTNGCT